MTEKDLIELFEKFESPTSFWRGVPKSNYKELAKELIKQFSIEVPIYYTIENLEEDEYKLLDTYIANYSPGL